MHLPSFTGTRLMSVNLSTHGVRAAGRGDTRNLGPLGLGHNLGFPDTVEEGVASIAAWAGADGVVIYHLDI